MNDPLLNMIGCRAASTTQMFCMIDMPRSMHRQMTGTLTGKALIGFEVVGK
jgi:hypothetical protein